jgi:hypothetical protein
MRIEGILAPDLLADREQRSAVGEDALAARLDGVELQLLMLLDFIVASSAVIPVLCPDWTQNRPTGIGDGRREILALFRTRTERDRCRGPACKKFFLCRYDRAHRQA